ASVKKKQAGSDKTKTPPTAKGKRLKTSTKAAKPAKKKQPAKTSKAKGVDEGTGCEPGVPDVPTYEYDDEKISWKSSDEEDNDDDNDDDDKDNDDDEDNDDDDDNDDVDDNADNQDDDGQDDNGQEYDGQDDEEVRQDEEDNKEEGSDLRVQTPSHYESTDDEESDEVTHGTNVEGEELDKEETNKEDEANELYRDVIVNLEGRDTKMTDAPRTIIQTTQVIEDTHVIITLVNPEG
ncbi:hypothetical protein Tco_1162125, partial [Tanacetum coccineum]